VAKNEGLLETESDKRKRMGLEEEDSGDKKTMEAEEEEDAEKEKEERKVWKPICGGDASPTGPHGGTVSEYTTTGEKIRNPTSGGRRGRSGGMRMGGRGRGRGRGSRINHYGNEICARAAAASSVASEETIEGDKSRSGRDERTDKEKKMEENEDILQCLEDNIESLGNREKDWSRTTKYGKKSHANFDRWLDGGGEALLQERIRKEDVLFDL
jgi:hypothetical protein